MVIVEEDRMSGMASLSRLGTCLNKDFLRRLAHAGGRLESIGHVHQPGKARVGQRQGRDLSDGGDLVA